MMWRYGDHMSGWGWGVMGVSMLLFWAAVITALVLLVRSVSQGRGRDRDEARMSPEQVLAHRFARGEINLEEYHARLEALHGRGAPPRPGTPG